MAVTTEARKPFYAYVGVVDLAVEKARELPTDVVAKTSLLVPKTTAFVTELPGKVSAELPAKVKGLRGDVQGNLTEFASKATAVYGDLVQRGEKLVATIRKSPSTQAAAEQLDSATAKVKGAATSTRKAAKATAKAVDDAVEEIG